LNLHTATATAISIVSAPTNFSYGFVCLLSEPFATAFKSAR